MEGADSATGVSTLAKYLNPKIKVIGVEPEGAACMKASLERGEVMTLPKRQHDCGRYGSQDTRAINIFPYIQKNVDEILTVK